MSASSSYERSLSSGRQRSLISGLSIRSASFWATISSVVGSIRKSSPLTTRCTGWSANGASRGLSGPALRSTALGVLRSLDFRLTWELVSCTALVNTPATTDRSRGNSSKTGMSVGRSSSLSGGKILRVPQASPVLSGRYWIEPRIWSSVSTSMQAAVNASVTVAVVCWEPVGTKAKRAWGRVICSLTWLTAATTVSSAMTSCG